MNRKEAEKIHEEFRNNLDNCTSLNIRQMEQVCRLLGNILDSIITPEKPSDPRQDFEDKIIEEMQKQYKAPTTRPASAAWEAFKKATETTKAKSDKVGTGIVLMPLYSILAVGKIFIEGLRYGRDNWKKGVNNKEYQEERLEHAFLHLIKYKEGDRSEAHLAKVAWFCITQLELERLENESPRSVHQEETISNH